MGTGVSGAHRAGTTTATPARARITFQRTRTWKDSHDPDFEAKLDRIEEVLTRFPDRCFAFDQFGPLSIRPCHGTCWAARRHPDRLPATYHRTHGVRYFHGCYSISEDRLRGVLHEHKGGKHTLAAFKSIRATRPDGAPIYIICDNLSCNTTPAIRAWAARHKVELCLTPRGSCTPICGGATRTTDTPMCWPHNAANASGSVVNTTAGGAVLDPGRRDQPGDQ
jgi:hypothetical protein